MRVLLLLMASGMLTHCSCHRDPAQTEAAQAKPATAELAAINADTAKNAFQAEQRELQTQAFMFAGNTVQSYLQAIGMNNRTKADAMWASGKPPPRPDDVVLRNLNDIQSLRINTETPKALDADIPSQNVEVPVILTVTTTQTTYKLTGWYRLRKDRKQGDWEIVTASLQSRLD